MTRDARPIHVLIADDQALFRSGLARILAEHPRIKVAAEARDGEEALRLAHRVKPDVVLLDIRMPNMDGIEATRRIAKDLPETLIILLTTFDTESTVVEGLKAGAHGYVLKDSTPQAIAASVIAVFEGETVLSRVVVERVLDSVTGASTQRQNVDGLTAREVEILRLVAQGTPNKQIAPKLGISEKTVRNHVTNIYDKLQISDRAQMVLYAVRKGLLDL